jgi:hypothetical protein
MSGQLSVEKDIDMEIASKSTTAFVAPITRMFFVIPRIVVCEKGFRLFTVQKRTCA